MPPPTAEDVAALQAILEGIRELVEARFPGFTIADHQIGTISGVGAPTLARAQVAGKGRRLGTVQIGRLKALYLSWQDHSQLTETPESAPAEAGEELLRNP